MGIIEDYLIKKYNTNMLIKEYAMLELQIDKLPKYFDKQRFISTTEIEKLINSEGVLEIPCQSDKIISRIDNGTRDKL